MLGDWNTFERPSAQRGNGFENEITCGNARPERSSTGDHHQATVMTLNRNQSAGNHLLAGSPSRVIAGWMGVCGSCVFLVASLAGETTLCRAQGIEAEATSENPNAPAPTGQALLTRVVARPPLPIDQIASAFSGIESFPDDQASSDESPSQRQAEAVETGAGQSSKNPSRLEPLSQWIEQLGSTEFAEREKATANLRRIGLPALTLLRETAADHADIEVRMRASDIAEGIVEGESAGRIDAFLAGKDVSLDGWNIATKILGDGVRIRELYVDLAMRHEDVARSLNGSAADRHEALRSAITRIQRGMFVERRLPTQSDAIALLLLVNDRAVVTNGVDEGALFSVLQKEVSALLLKDPQLAQPFRNLLAGWMTREDVINRQEMLWLAMSWDLQEIMPLVLGTLRSDKDPVTLSMACQAMSRFASADATKHLQPLLTDERPASEQQYSSQRFAAGTIIQAQVRDAAIAAIVLIQGEKLSDFEMNDDARHPKYGFIVQEIGFPVDDPKPRAEVINRVEVELLDRQPTEQPVGEPAAQPGDEPNA